MIVQDAGTIQWLRIELDGWDDMSFQRRLEILRQVWLKISWDSSDADSVRVPIGDFFGQMWEPKKLSNLYFSVDESGFECRFPMPFRKSAKITLHNHGETLISGKILIGLTRDPVSDDVGYFHCGWHRSSENLTRYPHEVLKTTGRGRLAGCLLGVASFDRSFWALESDETILRDNSKSVFWQGTGLEDYFNGGWYYRTVFQNPLFGLTMKRPFRTVQYRFHLPDAVTFDKSLNMSFERGPGNTSHAAYDSIVYYYLDRPAEAFGDLFRRTWITSPTDEFEARSLMTRLWDYEKFDDFSNAEKLTQHALKYWNYPADIKAIFTKRVQEYQRVRGDTPDSGMQIFVYANKKTTVFLDGVAVLTTSDPLRTKVKNISLSPGKHVLSVESETKSWPDWVQVGLKTGKDIFGIDSSWRCAVNPTGDWHSVTHDDQSWTQEFTTCKGPPEQEAVPFVYPDSHVDLQSQVEGVRLVASPSSAFQKLGFRKVFTVK
jgi:hypothetical protein